MMFPSHALLSGIALYASAVSATTFQIDVSNANATLTFSPIALSGNQSDAVQGDIVVFNFHPKNHSVTQSSFKEPCTPLESGIDLGFVPVANASITPPTRQIVVNDTSPAANTPAAHCGKGMVNNSFPDYLANALAVGAALQKNATNTTTPTASTASGSASTSTSTGLGGSKTNGAISANIDGVNAMLMAGLGMVASLLF
ncbi:hypothetical protein BGY98DRAFT_943080 [Russula aff. rugulosa BPL654]|nr:hypothetical protein BGY98DRAFT_943080 [Russula aff. rugulosa BPL654]